jgi:phage terminase large subunit-like protein
MVLKIERFQPEGMNVRMSGEKPSYSHTVSGLNIVLLMPSGACSAVSPPLERPVYEPSKRRLTWSSGAIATTYLASAPDAPTGPGCIASYAAPMWPWRCIAGEKLFVDFADRTGEVVENLSLATRSGPSASWESR